MPALAHTAHNSQNPGHQNEGQSTFGPYPAIPDNNLRKGFDLDEQTVQHSKQVFSGKRYLESLVESLVLEGVLDNEWTIPLIMPLSM